MLSKSKMVNYFWCIFYFGREVYLNVFFSPDKKLKYFATVKLLIF